MKIALINDTHAGVKSGSDVFLDYSERFYSEIFFPHCLAEGIKQIIHLGDYFEHRKYVNYKVLQRNREMFLDKLKEYGMVMDIIPGNHDVYWKNTNSLCSLKEYLSHYSPEVNVFMKPTVKEYDGLNIGLLPWITTDNYADSMKFIETANASVIASHLELHGFEMMKGAPAVSHGMAPELFSRYEMVLSGHYHTKSSDRNIHYLGTQYELTWSDASDPKYFHVLDTATRDLIAIRNPLCIFQRLVYDDSQKDSPIEYVNSLDLSHTKGTFIKVIVNSKKDPYAFDKYIDKLQAAEPFDIKIIESFSEYAAESIEDEAICMADTGTLLNSYVEAIETELNKEKIKSRLHELFVEAQTMDAL
jgi:DNA repair exonuclease SbcCD nuclease subunit